MMQQTLQPSGYSFRVFNPIFEGQSNEALYDALCAATAPLDAGLEELQLRLRPIILNASRAFLKALSWTFDNAMGEALIFIWELVRKHSYHGMENKGARFHTFFARSWMNRLNSLYEKAILKGPVMTGTVQTGWCAHQPVYVSAYAFDPKADVYRAQQRARNVAYYDRQLAAQRKTRQPVLTDEEREVRKAEARKKAAERALAWQREHRDEYNRRRAEIRRQKKEGTFVDQRKKGKKEN